jgi:hypothetical protein
MSGNLEVKLVINTGQKSDLEKTAILFGQALDRMGMGAGEAHADSVGHNVRIRASGVTGLTEVATPISASFVPGKPGRLGMMDIKVDQHPEGSNGAIQLADDIARRVAAAFNLELPERGRKVKAKRQGCKIFYPVNGWQGEFDVIFADYK